MQAVGAAEKVFEFIDRQSRMPLDLGKFDPPSIKGEIEFKNVSFYYPTRPDQPVLTNLNLTFPQGKVTALVGSSGGGKSSIVSLLCRSGIQEQCLKAVDVAVNTLGIPGKGSMIVLAERF